MGYTLCTFRSTWPPVELLHWPGRSRLWPLTFGRAYRSSSRLVLPKSHWKVSSAGMIILMASVTSPLMAYNWSPGCAPMLVSAAILSRLNAWIEISHELVMIILNIIIIFTNCCSHLARCKEKVDFVLIFTNATMAMNITSSLDSTLKADQCGMSPAVIVEGTPLVPCQVVFIRDSFEDQSEWVATSWHQ